MTEFLITGGRVIAAKGEIKADVHVVGDKVKAVGKGLRQKLVRRFSGRVIEAQGCYVIPGGIDPHVHMELPFGDTASVDNFESGTRAALAGGTTTVIDFANQEKGRSLLEALDRWDQKARNRCFCDYGFHVSVTDFNARTADEMARCVERGVTSFKTFTAYRGALMIDDRQMLEVMLRAKELGCIVAVHAENGDLIAGKVEQFRKEGKLAPKYHALSRPPLFEAEAVSRVMDLSRFAGCPLYIVHLSSGEGLERVRERLAGASPPQSKRAKSKRAPIFVETCPQYLLLDDSLYGEGFEGAKYILSPPLRKREDMKALWGGLAKNCVNTVATDHCPFDMSQREVGREDFSRIPNGIGGVEHRVELLYSEGVAKGKLTLDQWVQVSSTHAARIFGLYPRKGVIAPGSDADLVIFDPEAKRRISAETHYSRGKDSVYEGLAVRGQCRTVILRGQVAVDGGEILVPKGTGQYLKRGRFNLERGL